PYVEEHQRTQHRAQQDHVVETATQFGPQQNTGDKSKSSAPAEPPQCPWCQLGLRVLQPFGRRVLEISALHEIEVIQHTDPGDAEHHMSPAKDKVQCNYCVHYGYLLLIHPE